LAALAYSRGLEKDNVGVDTTESTFFIELRSGYAPFYMLLIRRSQPCFEFVVGTVLELTTARFVLPQLSNG
jgi:hypothetical protein